jgi:hypothetical protein
MFSRDGRRSPYAVLVPFAAVALVSTTTLAWLVREQWRQDDIVAAQQRQEHFDRAAAAVAHSLQRYVTGLEALSRDRDPDSLPDGVSLVTVSPTETRVRPAGSLPFLPQPDSPAEPTGRAELARLEILEFAPNGSGQALSGYNRLSGSRDPATRGVALVRLARMERKAGRYQRALAAYEQLSSLAAVSVDRLPAPLVARVGRLETLKQAGEDVAVRKAAAALRDDLLYGAWPVTKGQYVFYLREAERELEGPAGAAPARSDNLARAEAVEQLSLKRLTLPASGRLVASGEPSTLLAWRRTGDHWRIAVAGPEHLTRAWQSSVPAGFSATYSTRDGRLLSGSGVVGGPSSCGGWTIS